LKSTYFPDGLPSELKIAFETAAETCRPSTLESVNRSNKILGALCLIPGGILALTGFGSIKTKGILIPEAVDPRSWPGKVWDWVWNIPTPQTHPAGINWNGITFTVVGIILVAIGIYLVRRRANPKYQASIAEAIIQTAIKRWASEVAGVDGKAPPLIEDQQPK
jgi:hypothetical protein